LAGRRAGRNLLTGIAVGAGGAILLIVAPVLIGSGAFRIRARTRRFSWGGGSLHPGVAVLRRGGRRNRLSRISAAVPHARLWSLDFHHRDRHTFRLLHGFNPGATPLSMANTAGFGILFGVALLRSHDLWLPIGFHFGWNAALPFLGVSLSGFTIQVVGYQLVWKAGDLWSGGTYGPEASLLASGFC
jgi:hypothetical protein